MNHTQSIRNSVFFVAIIVLIAALGLYTYLYKSTWSQVENALSARRAVLAAEATRAQSKEIQSLYKETETQRAKIKKYFVPAANAVSFIKAVESVGTVSGSKVTISGIKSNPPANDSKDRIGSVKADVSVVGSWTEVMMALELFESLPYGSIISRVNLTSSGGASGADREKDVSSGRLWSLSFDIAVSTI